MVALPLAAQIAGNDEWLAAAEARAQHNLSFAAGLFSATMARVGLALVAVQRDDSASAQEQYDALAPVPGIMVFYIGTDQVLGLLSVTLGRLDQAVAHFEDSLDFCRKAGYQPNLAWSCYDYAGALSQRSGDGDRERAAALLDESLAISTELGMRPLMERVADRQAAMETQQAAPATYPGGLTQREVEVLRLLAQGRSNSQISQELVVAEGTTRRHVANIYEKIGVANRAEATRYALREGLLSLDESPPSDPGL